MQTSRYYTAPEWLGPLALQVTIGDSGTVARYVVYVAGREYPIERLTTHEIDWVHEKLSAYGVQS